MGKYKEIFEEIDASVFSGDLFYDKEERSEFVEYLGRWAREISKIQQSETENCEVCKQTDRPTFGTIVDAVFICDNCGRGCVDREVNIARHNK